MHEYILRDGEIAVNLPNGTVTIMNINTYMDLKARMEDEQKELSDLRKRVEFQEELLRGHREFEKKIKAERDEAIVELAAAKREIGILRGEVAAKNGIIDELDKEKKNLRKEYEDFKAKNQNAVLTELPLVEDYGQVPSAEKPQSGNVYITDDGRVFANQFSVEKFLNLKYHGEVSEYCNGRRVTLLDKNGNDHALVVWSWSYIYLAGRKDTAGLRRYLQAVADAKTRLRNQSK